MGLTDRRKTAKNLVDSRKNCSLRSRRLEVVGERENGRSRGRHAGEILTVSRKLSKKR